MQNEVKSLREACISIETTDMYFQVHPIVLVSSIPIKAVLHKLEVLGRLAKWVIKLG